MNETGKCSLLPTACIIMVSWSSPTNGSNFSFPKIMAKKAEESMKFISSMPYPIAVAVNIIKIEW